MKTMLLVNSIVRQTVVLISQLATQGGVRAPLAHVADRVFTDLAKELQNQGVSSKVIADMFGMALRTYHRRVQVLSESHTDRGRSLWEAVLAYVRSTEGVSRARLLTRFVRDDDTVLRAVLYDLVQSGLIVRQGSGDATEYSPAPPRDDSEPTEAADALTEEALVWVELHGSGPATAEELTDRTHLSHEVVEAALERLLDDGRARALKDDGDDSGQNGTKFSSDSVLIPVGAEAGWEGALLDHYQTLTRALAAKLRKGRRRSAKTDRTGGSTYHLRLWSGHPREERVLSLLADLRRELSQLRDEVNAANAPTGPQHLYTVHFYLGQWIEDDPVPSSLDEGGHSE